MIRLIFGGVKKFAEGGWVPYTRRDGQPGEKKMGAGGKWRYRPTQGGGAKSPKQDAPPSPGGDAPVAKTVITPKGTEVEEPKGGGDPQAAAGKMKMRIGAKKEAAPAAEPPKRERYLRKDDKVGERWQVNGRWRYGKTHVEAQEGEVEKLKAAKTKGKAPAKVAAKPKVDAAPQSRTDKAVSQMRKDMGAKEQPETADKPTKKPIPGLVDKDWTKQQQQAKKSQPPQDETPETKSAIEPNKPIIGSSDPRSQQTTPPAKPGEMPSSLKSLADAAHDPAALRKAAEGNANNLEAHDAISAAMRGDYGKDVQKAVNEGFDDWQSHQGKLVPKLERIGQALKGVGSGPDTSTATPDTAPAKSGSSAANEPSSEAKPDARQDELAKLIAEQKADMEGGQPKKSGRVGIRFKGTSSNPKRDAQAKRLLYEREKKKRLQDSIEARKKERSDEANAVFPSRPTGDFPSMDEVNKMRLEHGGGVALPKEGRALYRGPKPTEGKVHGDEVAKELDRKRAEAKAKKPLEPMKSAAHETSSLDKAKSQYDEAYSNALNMDEGQISKAMSVFASLSLEDLKKLADHANVHIGSKSKRAAIDALAQHLIGRKEFHNMANIHPGDE